MTCDLWAVGQKAPHAKNEALPARLDVLSVALQETVRALAPAQAAQIADAIRARVAALALLPMTPAADEALSFELVPMLAVLRAPSR